MSGNPSQSCEQRTALALGRLAPRSGSRTAYGLAVALSVMLATAAGCGGRTQTPVVIFLDGASHFTAGGSVKAGLRSAGYRGGFENFVWTSFLGYGADHFVVARSTAKARSLAKRIERIRSEDPNGAIHVMGLSAGTALVLSALEQLPDDVMVDDVVLFSSSVSANRNLVCATRHVRGKLYATASPLDLILATIPLNADGGTGPAAGRTGFQVPRGLTSTQREGYARVVNLRWSPAYLALGWNGGHVNATDSKFVRNVIAPRILSADPFPLDRPLVRGGQSQPTTDAAQDQASDHPNTD